MTSRAAIRVLRWLSLSVAITAATAAAATAEVTLLGRFALEKDKPVFWDGPEHVDGDPADLARPPGCAERRCFGYELQVPEGGVRLRVALDHADDLDLIGVALTPLGEPTDDGDLFTLFLVDPHGVETSPADGTAAGSGDGRYSAELAVEHPIAGTWQAWVHPFAENTDSSFRMRAKLESRPPIDTGSKLLLPNLRLTPPFEFVAGADFSAGVAPTGCLAQEIANGARSCVRFSMGPEDIGGRLELVFGREASSPTGGTVIQRVYCRDGSYEEREAGRYELHAEHTHYHHDGFARTELYRVTDATRGALAYAGEGPKQGFCMGDYGIARWGSFDNELSDSPSNCGVADIPGQEKVVGLSAGWVDVYAYYLEGNYVEFGDNPSGSYVVRVRGNNEDAIHETTTADNHSYALIDVERDALTGVVRVTKVRERGYGTDPWDPGKRIATDIRNDCVDECIEE